MKLEQYRHGALVIDGHLQHGVLVGVSENGVGECIALVQWQNGATYSTHFANIKLV
jgi:hypothetical protein